MKARLPHGGFALGLVVGLLVGLSLALAVALYISKVPIPFVDKVPTRSAEQDAAEAARNKDWDPNAPLAGKSAVRPAAAASGRVDASPKSSPGASAAAAASSPRSGRDPAAILSGGAAEPTARKSTGSAPAAFVFYVQAGAYSRAEDAEQQRASVTMLGFEARVSEREQSGRTVYRVRIGPFDQRDDAEAVQSRLVAAKIESNLVRAER